MKNIASLLTPGKSQLGKIIEKTDHIQKLTAILHSCLEEPLKSYCLAANLQDGCLTIRTESAVWATQLRYLTPDLLKQLCEYPEFRSIQSIRCYVATGSIPPVGCK